MISPLLRADILNALAHPNRIRILEAIRKGFTCSCEIAPELQLEQSNLSRHIKILVNSGILIPRRDGVRINYHVSSKHIYPLLDMAGEIVRDRAPQNLIEHTE
ncbi:metalloregulator ArsR/SmtB family transcription factor [Balneolaceae bacterium ANBcel3]|nr:metalloregulator ArsR/SmtB family transcription factor [Balneolaceae bacterium ANBcel3]